MDVNNPNGTYDLDLSDSADSHVAKQLLDLAKEHGVDSWKTTLLNEQPFLLQSKVAASFKQSVRKPLLQVKQNGVVSWEIPDDGHLIVEFVASKRPSLSDRPLKDDDFQSLWMRLTADRRPPSASSKNNCPRSLLFYSSLSDSRFF